MIKYIKWILLVLLILFIILLGLKAINYDFSGKITEQGVINFDITKIYNTAWNKTGVAYYENDILFSENLNLDDSRYMIFTEKNVTYINPMTEQTDIYDYSYEDGIITINSENHFLVNGSYNISFEDDKLKLSQLIDGNEYIYYFTASLG